MRGKVYTAVKNAVDKRITPAYAGKSLHNACQIILSQDHPRLCGEKRRSCRCPRSLSGSPPPMRGKDPVKLFPDVCTRITPAYAGKSNALCFCHCVNTGSPPPMRGKAGCSMCGFGIHRITPAYAGKSNSSGTRLNMN